MGGTGSRLSASHVIARNKLYPEGGRPLSKSTSRIGEVVADNVVTFSNEQDVAIAEEPTAIVQSEGMPKVHNVPQLHEECFSYSNTF